MSIGQNNRCHCCQLFEEFSAVLTIKISCWENICNLDGVCEEGGGRVFKSKACRKTAEECRGMQCLELFKGETISRPASVVYSLPFDKSLVEFFIQGLFLSFTGLCCILWSHGFRAPHCLNKKSKSGEVDFLDATYLQRNKRSLKNIW